MCIVKSQDKNGVLELAAKGQIIRFPQDVVKDTFILEFLGIPEKRKYSELSLEKALIGNMQSFLLELGKGFAFI